MHTEDALTHGKIYKLDNRNLLPNISITFRGTSLERHVVSNYRQFKCLLNSLSRLAPIETPKLLITGALWGESTVDKWFPSQRASEAASFSLSWRHHLHTRLLLYYPGVLQYRVSLLNSPLDKMAAISQTTPSNSFSWMRMLEFLLKFHWNLFLRVQLTISQHWFR